MKHTPGPWIIGKINTGPVSGSVPIYTDGYATSLRSGQLICSVYGTASFSEANALLIAAAPDLLEACQRALHWIRPAGDPDAEFIRAAIRKATGGE